MRFTCKRSRLAEVSGLVGQAVAGKSTKKIFECLHLVATKDSIEISGTDLEVATRYRVRDDLTVAEEGEAVVPAQLFSGILREVGDETISVSVARQKLKIDTDGGEFELECEDPSQYPEIPTFPKASTGHIGAEDLRGLVRKTVFAAGKEAARFVLNGVRLLVEEDGIRFVATDGRRLATLRRPLEASGDIRPGSAIVGVKGLQHFERVAASVDGTLELALADRFVALRTEDAEVTVRVMDGTFPDHNQIVPDECASEASIPVGVFASRLRQASQFSSIESQSVALQFRSGELEISAAGGSGRASVRLGIEYEGDDIQIGFNPAFVLEGLKVVEGERVKLGLNNPNAAAKLSDDAGLVYVVMPVLID